MCLCVSLRSLKFFETFFSVVAVCSGPYSYAYICMYMHVRRMTLVAESDSSLFGLKLSRLVVGGGESGF